MVPTFLFATGVESSAPTVEGGRRRVDQMASSDHYRRWRDDFDCVQQLGLNVLRYGPPLHRCWLGPDHYDWEFADLTFGELLRRDILPIVDLCHFGVPDWIGNFQNPDFAPLFARYAAAFAQRFPWVQMYTPVNEMFVCATFSAAYGWWNEQLSSDIAFVTAIKHMARANVLAMHAILEVRPDAIFVHSESSEYFHPDSPRAVERASMLNGLRFLALDLSYARPVESTLYEFLTDNGMARDEYHFFLRQRLRQHCILGTDYYATNEHRVFDDGSTAPSGEVFGYDQITLQYHRRYGLPVMHTETNLAEGPEGDEAAYWLWKEWVNVLHLRNDGVPILGFTWYSITDQVDWDSALRNDAGHLHPVGLFDLERRIRPVGEAFRRIVAEWSDVLPARSVCLRLPVYPPSRSRQALFTPPAHGS